MELEVLVKNGVNAVGLELVDLHWQARSGLLQVFVERPLSEGGGASIADCARASQHLTPLLTAQQVAYRCLEVSSPGMDRPLKKQADFERFLGSQIKIKLFIPREGRRNFVGELTEVLAGEIAVKGETLWRFKLSELESVRLAPQW